MNLLIAQANGGFSLSWTVGVLYVLGMILLLVIFGALALAFSGGADKKKFGISLAGFFSLLLLFVASLATTFWINVHEVGIIESQHLKTGVHPFRTEGGLQIPRNDTLVLVKDSNIGEISVNWSIEQPDKLVPYFDEIRSFDTGGSDESTFQSWISVKLQPVNPQSRELLLTVEDLAKLNEDFGRKVQSILGEYGMKTRVFVTKRYVIDFGDSSKE